MTQPLDFITLARARRDDLVDFAVRLIQTPSMSGDEGQAAALIQDEMRRLGYDEVRADAVGNVIGLLRGTGGGRSVMFNTHLDHVSPGDRSLWTTDPFSAAIRDNAIYGRGAVDIKGPTASQVYGAALLRDAGVTPAGDIYVVCAVMEELGGLGSRRLAAELKTDCAVVGEPSNNELRRGHRGRVGLIVEVRGRAAHASTPARAINPHYGLAAFLSALPTLEMPRQEPFGASSAAPTLYSTDNASSNVIPSTARLYLDWRNVPAQSTDAVLDAVRGLLARTIPAEMTAAVRVDTENMTTYTGEKEDLPSIFPSFVLNDDDPLVVLAGETLQSALGRPFPSGIWNFATDGGHLMAGGIPTVGFGPGDDAQAHVADEHIPIAQLVEAAAGNAALALALSERPAG